ncbi:hypothetical protein [Moraxella catarrhalis]|uniref:hypothetical protein n=1 Tax=Moraxella catarrhalis TaxID=480 RepID=UPI000AB2C4CA|nr:hypothetical protein [Moraxella catarrhalis]
MLGGHLGRLSSIGIMMAGISAGTGIMMGGAGGSMVKIKPLHCMQGLWMVGLCLGG